jgi:glutathione S-transferase
VAERYTVADIALYAYTHLAPQCDYDLAPFPAIRAWLDRIAAEPRHITMDELPAQAVAAE